MKVTGEELLQAERGVIGSMLRDPGWAADEAARLLAAEHLSGHLERLAFEAVGAVRASGRLPTLDVVHLQLVQSGHKEHFAGQPGGLVGWLTRAWEDTPTAVNLEWFAATVREEATRRQLVAIGEEIARDLRDGVEPAADAAGRFSDRLATLAAAAAAGDPLPLAAVLDAGLADLRRRHAAEDRRGRVRLGFAELDRLVPSLDPGDLLILAARPGVGKTALALNLSAEAALRGRSVLFFSLEMGRVEIGQRLLFAAAGAPGGRLRAGVASDQELADLDRWVPELAALPLAVDDAPDRTVERITAVARRHQRRRGLDLVVVDYLQLVPPTDRRAPRREQVEHVSRSLKLAAKSLGCPVLALAQLNREAENRTDNRPRLADLREAGGIEQDADAVVLLWRQPGQPDDAPTLKVTALVEKNRNGPTGSAELVYRRACTRFEEPPPAVPA